MANYFDTYKKQDCNGCGTCALRCPTQAIQMKEDSEGFLYPEINKEKCIYCNLCKKICPNKAVVNSYKGSTYITINKDQEEKKRSSSGGVFYPIARYIIQNHGVVFGVTQNENLDVYHDFCENLDGIKKFQGSKYVKSDLKNSYVKAEKFLKKNRLVLFTGTPCQCMGLKAYLRKEYEKLITCEIVCHANPSPKVYKFYLKNLEKKYNKKVKNIIFRTKENGWRNQTPVVYFEDNTKIEENTYFYAFINEMINRPSCYKCYFSGIERYSDFSIADLWGIDKIDPTVINDDTGISLLNVNTEKGFVILKSIEKSFFLREVNTNLAFSYNHHCNVKEHPKRTIFFNKLSTGEINETNIIDFMRRYTKKPLYKKIINKCKKVFKKIIGV